MAHQHYKGTGQMHSFRGFLADGGQDKIRIEGATGEIAWRLTKFQGVPNAPGTVDGEHITKIYREEQTSIDGIIDFNDDELLASLDFTNRTVPLRTSQNVIFDNDLFVRNIWITHTDITGSASGNYYIELEEVKVSAAGMAQLAVAAARRT